jgi:hypothetical protein
MQVPGDRHVRFGCMTAAERLLYEACNSPPTTSEWLAWLRRTGERTRFWNGRRWHRRFRPFISPRTYPLTSYTTQGYWWVRLPKDQ